MISKNIENLKNIIFFLIKKKINRVHNIINSNFFEKIFMYRYFKDRYLQVSKLIKLSNMVLVSHPSIYKDNMHVNKNTHYIFPKIKKFKPNKPKNNNRIFKFSGDLTSYRFSIFLKLRKKLLFKSNIKNSYEIFLRNIELKKKNFVDINERHKFKYSFHPKKNYEWQFSSPIRYIESIKKGEIPIIFQKFTDPISKKLAFYINVNSNKNIKKFFLQENLNIKLLKKNIIFYNSKVKKNNIKILKK